MTKTAEERYQSAFGIKADLEKCLKQLQEQGTLSIFPLALQDISNKFKLPQKLYGREREIEILQAAFERVNFQSEMILIAGYSGIGKTALVHEIYKPITQKRGYFISGKFDQYQRNIPYSAIVTAFQALVKQLLTESEAQLREWREKLLAALKSNGQVIIDVIPEIELIIGQQPSLPELGATESQNRFNLVFQNFIKVFTKPEHPLVLFIDDLQWADGASLELIQVLMRANSSGLFLIGAYRDQEVNSVHPLMLTLDKMAQKKVVINQIYLSPLDQTTVIQILADSIDCHSEFVKPLAELVYLKTGGNPFFMNEFLKSLYTEGLLKFNYINLKWQWNLEQIKNRNFTDNVVDFMAEKIKNLPDNLQEILTISACIGNQFNLEVLSLVTQKKVTEIISILLRAIVENLVTPVESQVDVKLVLTPEEILLTPLERQQMTSLDYQFNHDRIQQAAYGLIEANKKPYFHQKIGKVLLKKSKDHNLDEKIFDIVNQLNLGISSIFDPSEKTQLAELNLMAGKKAKLSAAYQPALNYLQKGIELLALDSWETQYNLTLSLYEEAGEVAYLNTNFDLMETYFNEVLLNSKTVLDKVKVYEVKITAYNVQGKFNEAVKIGLEVLNLLGIKLPKNPNWFDIGWGLLRTKLTIGLRPIDSLVDLPMMTNPHSKAAMRILSKISSTTYMVAPLLLPLVVFQQVNLSIQWGNTSESAFSAYSGYGTILCGFLGDIKTGYQFGQLALKLLSKINVKELKCRTEFTVLIFIKHWVEPVKEILNPLQKSYQIGLETGDLEFAAHSAYNYCYSAFLSGSELTQLELEVANYTQVMRQLGQERNVDVNSIFHQTILNLLGQSETPYCLIGKVFNEQEKLPIFYSRNDRNGIYYLHFIKLMLCFIFEELEQAAINANLAENYNDGSLALLTVPQFYFYESLVYLSLDPTQPLFKQKQILKRVKNNQKKMKKWAHYSPSNTLHKYCLVEAEYCRVLGKNFLAIDYYDQAITLAKNNEYLHEVAIACELASKFYLLQNKEISAKAYMQEACYYYQLWGATAKVKHLQVKYPNLLTLTPSGISVSQITTTSSGKNLDIATVLKSSQAISGEIMLDKLLSSLMRIIIENAGAQQGYLILCSNNKLLIEAEGTIGKHQVTVLQSIPLESYPQISESIVNYVLRTQQDVVLNDAHQEGLFTQDPYINEYKPKSILCAPLIHQGQLISIIYLENNLTTGAFTQERVEMLKLLSGQAAISIQNAQLYQQVRENESRLAQFLDAIPVGVGIIDSSGKPLYTNRVAQELLGKGVIPNATSDQLTEVYQLYKAGTNEKYLSKDLPLVRALNGETTIADNIEIHQAEKIIPIEGIAQPIYDQKGNLVYAITAFQDITERKKAESERQQFTNQLFELNQAYERFVPRQFLQFLEKSSIVDVKLGDNVQLEMSVLFSDIRDFTTLSESITPEENFKFINSYLSHMEPAIIENQGFIDKYIGDAIMALFSGEADNAVQAGISMLKRLAEYNVNRNQNNDPKLEIGIGINTGSLMLGTVGGKNRMDGTVISDAVNLASRVESLTKNYQVSLLITQQTYSRLKNLSNYTIRTIDTVKVKGKSEAVTVYEVFDADSPEVKEGKLATLPLFTEGLELYSQGKFLEAGRLFAQCWHCNPEDQVAKIYWQRCQQQ